MVDSIELNLNRCDDKPEMICNCTSLPRETIFLAEDQSRGQNSSIFCQKVLKTIKIDIQKSTTRWSSCLASKQIDQPIFPNQIFESITSIIKKYL